MNVAIVGCGAVGALRARALDELSTRALDEPGRDSRRLQPRLVHCVDTDLMLAERTAAPRAGCASSSDWRVALDRGDVDAVIIATPHDSLAPIARAAIEAGKHVLLEKPGARRSAEIAALPALAAARGVRVRVGFNHRYHRAFRQARLIVDSGALGPLMYARARYGHGGRPGYESEWRAQPDRSGGGELIDQGVHLIDLSRWFLGEFVEVDGFLHTYFWNMPVEDNAFMVLRTAARQTAFLHASCTEWKNTFSFELYGREGKLQVDGLGGSYGTERLTWYKMLPRMGPPETTSWEYPMPDDSWTVELAEFFEDIDRARAPVPGLNDAAAVLDIVGRLYETRQP